MEVLKQSIITTPDFGLPEQYTPNIWDIPKWDIYTTATEKQQQRWKACSGKNTNYKIDFTIFENESIREEIKYCLYLIIDNQQCNVASLGRKMLIIKCIAKYLNDRSFNSLSQIDILDYTNYLTSIGIKSVINNGSSVAISKGKMVKATRNNRYITLFQIFIDNIRNYNSEDSCGTINDDIWRSDKVSPNENLDCVRRIRFDDIANNEFKSHLKAFAKNRLNSIGFTSINSYVLSIKCFFSWLSLNRSEICHLDQINRTDLEDYFVWLRTKSGFSNTKINVNILNLKVFLEYGILLELENFPQNSLIINTDYAIKSKKQANPFTDDELKELIKIIPKLSPLHGKILFCALSLGCRIGELRHLNPSQLKQYPDGKYYLLLYQQKTRAEYEKPISNSIAKIMINEIKNNTNILGEEPKYVFINDDNTAVSESNLGRAINRVLVENNIKDRDGNILHFHFHRFRSTLATNLLSSGYDIETTGKLLGHKSLSSLAYYANVTNEQAKEQLSPRIEKDELLISNIGKIDTKVLSDYKNPIQLCNGWCTRSTTMGQCAKANHCLECNLFIPTFAHLSMYEMQLRQVEANIAVAKANDMELLVEKNEKTKAALEKIIAKIRERR